MKIRSYLPFCAAFFSLAGPCHAILITLDPLSTDTEVFGTWAQRRLGSSSGMWFLPGNMLLEMGLGREGRLPTSWGEIGDGRWATVSFRLTATGDPYGGGLYSLFHNQADNLGDDVQSSIKPGSDGRFYSYSFAGTYLPETDEWSGAFGVKVSRGNPVPDGGGTFLLLCGTLVGIHCLRWRLA